ncbi:unnamed protein product [Caenorhabditis nigoni]
MIHEICGRRLKIHGYPVNKCQMREQTLFEYICLAMFNNLLMCLPLDKHNPVVSTAGWTLVSPHIAGEDDAKST